MLPYATTSTTPTSSTTLNRLRSPCKLTTVVSMGSDSDRQLELCVRSGRAGADTVVHDVQDACSAFRTAGTPVDVGPTGPLVSDPNDVCYNIYGDEGYNGEGDRGCADDDGDGDGAGEGDDKSTSSLTRNFAKRIIDLLTSRVTISGYNSVGNTATATDTRTTRNFTAGVDKNKEFMPEGYLCDGCLFFYMSNNIYPRPPVLRRQDNMGSSKFSLDVLSLHADTDRCTRCGMLT